MKETIPLFPTSRLYDAYGDEYRAAFERVAKSYLYLRGPQTRAFEREFASFIGAPDADYHGIAVSNGTAAIQLSLRMLGLPPGMVIYIPAFAPVAVPQAILGCGYVPALVDVDMTGCMDAGALICVQTWVNKGKEGAILVVHMWGGAAAIMKGFHLTAQIPVIEDCSHGLRGQYASGPGSRFVGRRGTVVLSSCYPTKHLGVMGDLGVVATRWKDLYLWAKKVREYGWTHQREVATSATNLRADELQCAFGRIRLRHYTEELARRREIASYYLEHLSHLAIFADNRPDWHVFPIRVGAHKREALITHLNRQEALIVKTHYPQPLHLIPALRQHMVIRGPYRNTEDLAQCEISLPCHAFLTDEEVEYVVERVKDACSPT